MKDSNFFPIYFSTKSKFVSNLKENLGISNLKYFGMLWILTNQDISISHHIYSSILRQKGNKKLQDITLLYNVLYKNLSFKLQETQSSISEKIPRSKINYVESFVQRSSTPFRQLVLMSRHGYRISICFSDKAVTTPVSH